MNVSIEAIFGLVEVVTVGIFGWLWRELSGLRMALDDVKRSHSDHRTLVAEKYVTKADIEVSLDRVYAVLERIEKKLDQPS